MSRREAMQFWKSFGWIPALVLAAHHCGAPAHAEDVSSASFDYPPFEDCQLVCNDPTDTLHLTDAIWVVNANGTINMDSVAEFPIDVSTLASKWSMGWRMAFDAPGWPGFGIYLPNGRVGESGWAIFNEPPPAHVLDDDGEWCGPANLRVDFTPSIDPVDGNDFLMDYVFTAVGPAPGPGCVIVNGFNVKVHAESEREKTWPDEVIAGGRIFTEAIQWPGHFETRFEVQFGPYAMPGAGSANWYDAGDPGHPVPEFLLDQMLPLEWTEGLQWHVRVRWVHAPGKSVRFQWR